MPTPTAASITNNGESMINIKSIEFLIGVAALFVLIVCCFIVAYSGYRYGRMKNKNETDKGHVVKGVNRLELTTVYSNSVPTQNVTSNPSPILTMIPAMIPGSSNSSLCATELDFANSHENISHEQEIQRADSEDVYTRNASQIAMDEEKETEEGIQREDSELLFAPHAVITHTGHVATKGMETQTKQPKNAFA